MNFEEALTRCSALADDLSAQGIRFRIVIDDGAGMTAELHSQRPARRP